MDRESPVPTGIVFGQSLGGWIAPANCDRCSSTRALIDDAFCDESSSSFGAVMEELGGHSGGGTGGRKLLHAFGRLFGAKQPQSRGEQLRRKTATALAKHAALLASAASTQQHIAESCAADMNGPNGLNSQLLQRRQLLDRLGLCSLQPQFQLQGQLLSRRLHLKLLAARTAVEVLRAAETVLRQRCDRLLQPLEIPQSLPCSGDADGGTSALETARVADAHNAMQLLVPPEQLTARDRRIRQILQQLSALSPLLSKVQSSIDDVRGSYEGTGAGYCQVRAGSRVGGEAAHTSSPGPSFGSDRRKSKTDGLPVNARSNNMGARKDGTPCTSEVSTPSLSEDMPPHARRRSSLLGSLRRRALSRERAKSIDNTQAKNSSRNSSENVSKMWASDGAPAPAARPLRSHDVETESKVRAHALRQLLAAEAQAEAEADRAAGGAGEGSTALATDCDGGWFGGRLGEAWALLADTRHNAGRLMQSWCFGTGRSDAQTAINASATSSATNSAESYLTPTVTAGDDPDTVETSIGSSISTSETSISTQPIVTPPVDAKAPTAVLLFVRSISRMISDEFALATRWETQRHRLKDNETARRAQVGINIEPASPDVDRISTTSSTESSVDRDSLRMSLRRSAVNVVRAPAKLLSLNRSVSREAPSGESAKTRTMNSDATDALVKLRAANLVADRKYRMKSYRDCFVASEAVDWMVSNFALCYDDRERAIRLCRQMYASGAIQHVTKEHDFDDAFLFFRFLDTSPVAERGGRKSASEVKAIAIESANTKLAAGTITETEFEQVQEAAEAARVAQEDEERAHSAFEREAAEAQRNAEISARKHHDEQMQQLALDEQEEQRLLISLVERVVFTRVHRLAFSYSAEKTRRWDREWRAMQRVMRQRSPEDWGIDSKYILEGFAHRIDRVGGDALPANGDVHRATPAVQQRRGSSALEDLSDIDERDLEGSAHLKSSSPPPPPVPPALQPVTQTRAASGQWRRRYVSNSIDINVLMRQREQHASQDLTIAANTLASERQTRSFEEHKHVGTADVHPSYWDFPRYLPLTRCRGAASVARWRSRRLARWRAAHSAPAASQLAAQPGRYTQSNFSPMLFGRTISAFSDISLCLSAPAIASAMLRAVRVLHVEAAAYALRSAELKLPHRERVALQERRRREQANAIGMSARACVAGEAGTVAGGVLLPVASAPAALGADDFIPILTYILVHAELPEPYACLHVLQNFFLCTDRDGMPRSGFAGGAAGNDTPVGKKRPEVDYYATCMRGAIGAVRQELKKECASHPDIEMTYVAALQIEIDNAQGGRHGISTHEWIRGAAAAEPLRANASLGGEKTDTNTNTNCSEESTGPAAGTKSKRAGHSELPPPSDSMDMFASGIVKVRTPSASHDDLEALADEQDEETSVQELGQWFTQQRAVDELMDVLM